LKSRLKPTHLAAGVAAVIVVVPLVALSFVDLSPGGGPVLRVRLADPVPYEDPGDGTTTDLVQKDDEQTPGEGPGEIRMVYPVEVGSTASRSDEPAERRQVSPASGRSSTSEDVSTGESRAVRPDPEDAPATVANGSPPVSPSPSTRPSATTARSQPQVVRAPPPVAPPPVASTTRPTPDPTQAEQEKGESVSDIEAAREALRDIRPR